MWPPPDHIASCHGDTVFLLWLRHVVFAQPQEAEAAKRAVWSASGLQHVAASESSFLAHTENLVPPPSAPLPPPPPPPPPQTRLLAKVKTPWPTKLEDSSGCLFSGWGTHECRCVRGAHLSLAFYLRQSCHGTLLLFFVLCHKICGDANAYLTCAWLVGTLSTADSGAILFNSPRQGTVPDGCALLFANPSANGG